MEREPSHVLYATSARIGGIGLDSVAHETLRGTKPYLQGSPGSVKILGFTNRVEELYRQCSVFVFPSECEGSAKSTYEAAGSGLAQIVTRESGDVVIDGLNGCVIPPKNEEAIGDAILRLCRNPDLALKMGAAGRERAVGQLTWDHFRRRVSEAYRAAMAISQPQLV
jgi:glycosyltransferase involved in cell wall biosynthesis